MDAKFTKLTIFAMAFQEIEKLKIQQFLVFYKTSLPL